MGHGKRFRWGRDTDLLRDCAETGIDRIRFYTSHPRDYSSTSIDVMKEYPNIMNSLHLPVQSGDNDILKIMNRKYTHEEYMAKVNKLRELVPDISLTTDIISKLILFNSSIFPYCNTSNISESVSFLAPFAARLRAWKILNGEIIKFSPILSLFILLNIVVWNEQFEKMIKIKIMHKLSNLFILK